MTGNRPTFRSRVFSSALVLAALPAGGIVFNAFLNAGLPSARNPIARTAYVPSEEDKSQLDYCNKWSGTAADEKKHIVDEVHFDMKLACIREEFWKFKPSN